MAEGITSREINLKCAGAMIVGYIGKGILSRDLDLTINDAHFVGKVSRGIGSFSADISEITKGRRLQFSISGILKSSAQLNVDGKQYVGNINRDLISRELELTASSAKVESIRIEKAILGKNVYISRNNEVKHELCLEGQISKDIYFTPPVPNSNKILIMLLFETYDQAMSEAENSSPLGTGVPGM